VAAHRQAARCLNEENRDVAIGAGRRIKDRARHHVVAARLEHEPGADPVMMFEEILPAVEHGGAFEPGHAAPGHDTNRIAASMSVDAKKCRSGHELAEMTEIIALSLYIV